MADTIKILICDDHAVVRRGLRSLVGVNPEMELIGEAATHIPSPVREVYANIPWRRIIALRNRLIHGYLGIDNDTIWSVITTDVPDLIPKLKAIKEKEEEEQ